MSDLTKRIRAVLPDGRPFALAFSGGGDSLALLKHLRDHPGLSAVLHVDHGLRDGSAAEAEQASLLATRLCQDLQVLRWQPGRLDSRIQESARKARYGLMGDECRKRGLDLLVTGHHADDQAETVLLRLKRGSGWRGAAGMQPLTYAPVWPEMAGLELCRPALGLSRSELRAILGQDQATEDQPIDDPSNIDRRYARIRIRQELAKRPGVRRDMLTLSESLRPGLNQDRRRLALALDGHHITHEGQLTVPRKLGVEALCRLAPIVGGQAGPASRVAMTEKLRPIDTGRLVSIGSGCMAQWDGEILTLSRDPVAMTGRRDRKLEPSAIPIAITPEPQVWDGRFLVRGAAGQLHPERRGGHVGFRVHYGRSVRIDNLVTARLQAALTQK